MKIIVVGTHQSGSTRVFNLIRLIYEKKGKRCFSCWDYNIKEHGEKKDYHYSGHGGSVYHRKDCIKFFNNTEILKEIKENWLNYHPDTITEVPHDYLLSMIIILQGGTICHYDGHGDNKGDVVHQYKKYYGKKLPKNIFKTF